MQAGAEDDVDEQEAGLLDLLVPLAEHLKLLVLGTLLAGLAALGITYLIAPTYTATTSFLPPQQQQSSLTAALSSLGPLAGLAGAAANVRTPADQYVALMQSVSVSDRIIDEFKLIDVYDVKYRVDARKDLADNVRMTVGKKDGLISVAVDDENPQRAASIANRYIDELRRMTSTIAVSEAQQRRVFFETQLKQTRDDLTRAQQQMQASGITQGTLKSEPKAAAEGYARLRAEVVAAEVRLQTMRKSLAENTPEVQQQQATLAALRGQLARAEKATSIDGVGNGPDYVSKYREFKYQETLFELFARQYELARVDESREGALIQVVDPALPPEKKSKPVRSLIAAATALLALLLLAGFVLAREAWRRSAADPASAPDVDRLRAALRRGPAESAVTVLVTGGAGFIGSNFVLDWLESSDESVVNLDALTYAGNLENLASLDADKRHVFVRGDIGDRALVDRLLAEHRPRALIHFAAESHVDRSIHGPAAFVKTNVEGTFTLLEAARAYWTALDADRARALPLPPCQHRRGVRQPRPEDPPFGEQHAYQPNSPYAASKAASDHLVRAWHHTYGLPVVTTNCSNNYGPWHFPEKLIPLMIVNALAGRRCRSTATD